MDAKRYLIVAGEGITVDQVNMQADCEFRSHPWVNKGTALKIDTHYSANIPYIPFLPDFAVKT